MIRINHYLAQSSMLSRRAADQAIAEGRVWLNGAAAEPGSQVGENDTVTLDGMVVTPRTAHRYFMLNKPVGYLCSRVSQGGSPTIYDLLPSELQHLKSVGRLDRDSSGLLLLSDDGDFIHHQLHPRFNKRKVYELKLSRPLSQEAQAQLASGVELSDGMSHLTIERITGRRITVSLEEGRNRQIRRTIKAIGNHVETLHRVAFGSYRLGALAPGELRDVTSQAST